MIKNLRSIFVVALMAVSGSMFAQGTTESKGEVIDFVETFSKYEKDATESIEKTDVERYIIKAQKAMTVLN